VLERRREREDRIRSGTVQSLIGQPLFGKFAWRVCDVRENLRRNFPGTEDIRVHESLWCYRADLAAREKLVARECTPLFIFFNKFRELDTLIRGESPSACQLGSRTYYYLSVLMDKSLF